MGENSKIEWTDHTFNPWIGCTKIADGCANCYAASEVTRYGKAKWGQNGTRVVTGEEYWKRPIKWNRDAAGLADRPRVFCASWADVFEDWDGPIMTAASKAHLTEELCICHGCGKFQRAMAGCDCDSPMRDRVPRRATMKDLRLRLFTLIDTTPNIDWLLLTKRPENIQRFWTADARRRWNVWLGTSIANQADADRNLPRLIECRPLASALFVSAEPLLGPVDLSPWIGVIDWAIAGGESGPHARPIYPRWPERLQEQCSRAGVAFHFKQWGEWLPDTEMTQAELRALWTEKNGKKVSSVPVRVIGPNGWEKYSKNSVDVYRVGKQRAGRLLNKRVYDEFPQPRVTNLEVQR